MRRKYNAGYKEVGEMRNFCLFIIAFVCCCNDVYATPIYYSDRYLAESEFRHCIPPQSINGLFKWRNLFANKVVVWERTHGKTMYVNDILKPFLIGGSNDEIIKYQQISNDRFDRLSKKVREQILSAAYSWYIAFYLFGNVKKISRRSRYDILFGIQGYMECARIGGSWFHKDLQFSIEEFYHVILGRKKYPDVVGEPGFTSDLFIEREHWRILGLRLLPPLPGLVLDAPVRKKQNILRRLVNGLLDIPTLPPLPVPELPRTSDDAPWRYAHEVRGIGFTVFMHLFPALRDQCAGFEEYGMGRGVIGDELYNELTRPFVQPPYELPASVFAEEAAMMADTEGGGAAAAASSAGTATGSATAGSDALPTASSPAAAAAASCADLPDESDDARESDTLLGGTGSHVRHRAAAMAAAAAVEEELHTSLS